MVQAVDQKANPQPAYSQTTALLANDTIQPWLSSRLSYTETPEKQAAEIAEAVDVEADAR